MNAHQRRKEARRIKRRIVRLLVKRGRIVDADLLRLVDVCIGSMRSKLDRIQ